MTGETEYFLEITVHTFIEEEQINLEKLKSINS